MRNLSINHLNLKIITYQLLSIQFSKKLLIVCYLAFYVLLTKSYQFLNIFDCCDIA